MDFFDVHTHNLNTENGIYNLQTPDFSYSKPAELNCSFSVGIHPCSILPDSFDSQKQIFTQALQMPNLLAIGECGFDKYAFADFETQKKVFLWQCEISELYRKPLIIHCVGYYNEIIKLKKEFKPSQKWLIHGFRAKAPLAQQLVQHGFYLSFGPLFNTESVAITPCEQLFCETDDNVNSNIEAVFRAVANVKSLSVDALKEISSKNAFLA